MPLRHGALLLCLVALLLLLLLPLHSRPPHETEQAADGGANGRSFARVAADRSSRSP
jgi:hypothetical protein